MGTRCLTTVEDRNQRTVGQYAWHVHHNVLIERLIEPLENRVEYIQQHKPKKEIPIRIERLNLCRDQKLAGELFVAYEARVRQAMEACQARIRQAWKAYQAEERRAREPLERLHAEECPDCPWNGCTLFPRE